MKTRIISGVCYSTLVIAVMFFMNTPVLPIGVALVSAIATYELNNIVKMKLPVEIVSIAAAAFIPFQIEYNILEKINLTPSVAFTVYIIAMLIMMVKWHSEVKFDQLAISVFSSIAVPEALSCWIRMADLHEKYCMPLVVYLVIFTLFCAWFSDIFAYFTGVFFGKHKMTPVVSPKKTWEGAIGGIILTAGLNIGLYFVFLNKYVPADNMLWEWYMVIPISIAMSIISIFGDLSASVVKRNYGVKDYGWIIPGHGGIMDRFDSLLFVFPAMYAVVEYFN